MHFVQPFQAQLGILIVLCELHQLLYGAVQLPDNVLQGQHAAQRELPVYHR